MNTHRATLDMKVAARTGRRFMHFAVAAGFASMAMSNFAVADITNSATAGGTYNGLAVISDPDTASVPVTVSTPSLVIAKIADDTTNVVAGQLITYTYTVENTGAQTLTNIVLSDVDNAAGPDPAPGSEALTTDGGTVGDSSDLVANNGQWSVLGPGDIITFTATHVVQQADVDLLQ